jgi:hypothetical protein
MNIIHFDLGSNMAFAHNGCGDVIVTDKFVATGPRAERQSQILAWLIKRKAQMAAAGIRFDVCHYERPFARGFDATRSGWGIAGLIEGVFGGDGVILDSTPQAIKKFALGTGGTKKAKNNKERAENNKNVKLAMIDAAQALGYAGDNEHEADAYMGLLYAVQYVAKPE